MKFEVKGFVGKHEVYREYPNFETAAKEYERLKKKGLDAALLVDGNDISSTVVITNKVKPSAETAVPVVSTPIENVVFAWKEGNAKKQIIVSADRAKLLLARAEKAGYQACVIGKDRKVIAKVNC